jgi:carbon-monoxide dehydrogenase small subunit
MLHRLTVNGDSVEVRTAPAVPLLKVLREQLSLTGTKEACGRGECGACTVLVDGSPVMSCVLVVEEAVGRSIRTIEGIADTQRSLRRAFAEHGGYQCGFCTPGQIVRASVLLADVAGMSDIELRRAMSGNICRCTGYQQLLQAVRTAAVPTEDAATKGSDDASA